MIKNIMKNIGLKPVEVEEKEEPKNVYGAEVDKIYERQLKRIKELRAKGFTDEQIDNDKIIKQTKEDMENVGKKPESNPSLEEVIKAKNDRIAELSKAHPNEWAMNGHNTDFDKIVENDPVIKKLDNFKF